MKKDIEILKKVNQLKSKIYYPRLYSAFQSTICFFCDGEKDSILPAGSGVFIKYKENYYVISAAHVLAEYYNDTFVILDDVELVIGGRLISSPMPSSGNRADDKIDIAIIKVDPSCVPQLLTRYKALDVNEIELGHQMKELTTYFSVGFPLTRTKKVWNANEIKSIGFSYQSEPFLNYNYDKFGFSSEINFAIKFDGEVTSAINPNDHLAPDITGISGSGIWHFSGKAEKRLIGIAIERIKETGHKCVIATKIDVVIKMIDDWNR